MPSCFLLPQVLVYHDVLGMTRACTTHPNQNSNCFLLPQVLVYHDLLGMMQHPHHAKVTPKFCKQFGAVGEVSLRLSSDSRFHSESPSSCKHLAAECTIRSTP